MKGKVQHFAQVYQECISKDRTKVSLHAKCLNYLNYSKITEFSLVNERFYVEISESVCFQVKVATREKLCHGDYESWPVIVMQGLLHSDLRLTRHGPDCSTVILGSVGESQADR